MLWRFVLAGMHCLGVAGVAIGGELSTAAQQLIAARRCEVSQRLEAIRRQPIDASLPDGGNGRFLVIGIRGKPHYFVQCMYHGGDAMVYCEAASGRYAPPSATAGDFPLAESRLAALRALGFDIEVTAGNFSLDGPVAPPEALADRMLAALHAAFGAEAKTELDYVAPLASGMRPSCEPTG